MKVKHTPTHAHMHLRLLHKNLGYMLWSAMKETTEIFTFEPNLHSKFRAKKENENK